MITPATEAYEHLRPLRDALFRLAAPALTIDDVIAAAPDPEAVRALLVGPRTRRTGPQYLRILSYEKVPSPTDTAHGRWRIDGRRLAVYVRTDLSPVHRVAAALERVRRGQA